MENRRRSVRSAIALPVWLKDAHGGTRTVTVDISAHGVSVWTDAARPLRRYVELEIELPDSDGVIAVTAMVARNDVVVDPKTGLARQHMGLEFFLFDTKSEARWQAFLREQAPMPEVEPALVPADDEVATFLIRPRDIDRLWTFFFGELARAQVRIEAAIERPPGAVVEIMVIHPRSGAEWLLDGEVLCVSRAHSGVARLEIGLPGLDPALKEAFHAFVRSGVGQIQEEVSLSGDLELELHRGQLGDGTQTGPIESVVIDFAPLEPDAATPMTEEEEDDPTVTAPAPHLSTRSTAPAPHQSTEMPPITRPSVFAPFFVEAAEARATPASAPPRSPPPLPRTPSMNGRSSPTPVRFDRRRLDEALGVRIGSVRGTRLDREIAVARARVARAAHGAENITARLALSALLSAWGDTRRLEEAIDIVRGVAAVAPHHPAAHYRLAELFARKGDYLLARAHLGQAKRLGFVIDPDLERVVMSGARAG